MNKSKKIFRKKSKKKSVNRLKIKTRKSIRKSKKKSVNRLKIKTRKSLRKSLRKSKKKSKSKSRKRIRGGGGVFGRLMGEDDKDIATYLRDKGIENTTYINSYGRVGVLIDKGDYKIDIADLTDEAKNRYSIKITDNSYTPSKEAYDDIFGKKNIYNFIKKFNENVKKLKFENIDSYSDFENPDSESDSY